jgi:hypothetical protein
MLVAAYGFMNIKPLFPLRWAIACLLLLGSAKAETPKLIVAILVDQLRCDYPERFHDQFTTNGFSLFNDS